MKGKIAIIEDDASLVEMYRIKFDLEGFEVRTAGDGIQGLKVIAEFKPDMVLLDLLMPNMGGAEMLKQLRKLPGGKNVKVIVLSNIYDVTTTNEVYQYAPEEYLVKAILTPQEVYEHVKNLLESKPS